MYICIYIYIYIYMCICIQLPKQTNSHIYTRTALESDSRVVLSGDVKTWLE